MLLIVIFLNVRNVSYRLQKVNIPAAGDDDDETCHASTRVLGNH